MARQRRPNQTSSRQHESTTKMTDAEVQTIMTQAMADSGATPAAVYAIHKTGVYLTEDNEHRWSPEQLRAWNEAVEEYNSLASRPNVVV